MPAVLEEEFAPPKTVEAVLPTNLAPLEVGTFVKFSADGPDVEAGSFGKVMSKESGTVEIEIFRSPVPPETEVVHARRESVASTRLPRQTPVYYKQATSWRLGRVDEDNGQGLIRVNFPNHERLDLARDEVFVRNPRMNDDPTLLLAAQVTNSPNFTEARHRLHAFAASQRYNYKGLSALATARVELYPHQLGAVRRVLSDPIHRYLLADEVGLGKTIEAGLLISQHLIDEGANASVLVVVPLALVPQWTVELSQTFGIHDDPRVRILSFQGLDGQSGFQDTSADFSLVVVDEAHRMAGWAFLPPQVPMYRLYHRLEELARCPKILLLSGTPVLHHEDGFLAMLHLLDPAAYALSDRDEFRRRIQAREVVAEALQELREDFMDCFLVPALERLLEETSQDPEISVRVKAIHTALEGPPESAGEAIEDLRSYLVERYRLHQRIIRTHRESPAVLGLLPARRGLTLLPAGDDALRVRTFEALEVWRRNVVNDGMEGAVEATQAFGDLLSYAMAHPERFRSALLRRAGNIAENRANPLFKDESSWLTTVAKEFQELLASAMDARMEALCAHLAGQDFASERVALMVDAPETAEALEVHLGAVPALATRVVRFRADKTGAVRRFEETDNAILICDRTGEEGLNLQKRKTRIIFFDLLMDIGRMEQRIGRFDRIEGMRNLTFYAMEPKGAYECAWAEFLNDSVQIFNRSVARLQYWLKDALAVFLQDLLANGPEEAFQRLGTRFADPGTGMNAELKRLRRQEFLDVTEWRDEELASFVGSAELARKEAAEDTRPAIEGWLRCVAFLLTRHPEEPGLVRYAHVNNYKTGLAGEIMNTLVPLPGEEGGIGRLVDRSASSINGTVHKVSFGPFSYDASHDSDAASLLGLGNPFFDLILSGVERDDRSKSWAFWRLNPVSAEPQVFLRFDLIVEADLTAVASLDRAWKTIKSIRRRADEVYPVAMKTCWVDLEGVTVTDERTLWALEPAYGHGVFKDQNLNPVRWALANPHLPVSDWGARIRAIRAGLEKDIRNTPSFIETCEAAAKQLSRMEQQTLRTLRSRMIHAPQREREALEKAIAMEQRLAEGLREGVLAPSLRIDNIGAVVLAPKELR